MEGLAYELELADHMSGPAGHASKGLDALAAEAMKTEKAIRDLTERQIGYREAGMGGIAKQAGYELARLRLHLGDVKKELGEAKEGGAFGKDLAASLVPEVALGELVGEALKSVAEGVVELAKGMAELSIEGVHFALEMSEFKEHAVDAYAVIKGTAEEGEATYEEIDKLAKAVHMPVMEAQKVATHLMEQGLENTESVRDVIQSISDLQRTGHEEGAEKLQSIISNSLATGFLKLPAKGLGSLGTPHLLEDLAAQFHMPVKQFQKEMTEMHITADQGVRALENTLLHSKVHEIAESKFTLQDFTNDIQNSFKTMFTGFDVEPVMSAFRDLGSLLDQDTASGRFFSTGLHAGIGGLLVLTHDLVEGVTLFGLTLENWALRGTIALFPLIRAFAKVAEWGQQIHDEMPSWLQWGAPDVTYPEQMVQGLKNLAPLLYSYGEGGLTGPPPEGPYKDAKRAGEHIADGLVEGTQEGLGIHSPSTVMAEIGHYAADGFAMGVEQGTAEGAGKSIVVEEGAIQAHIHVQGTAVSVDEIREGATAALEDVLEQLILELGG